MEFGKNLKQMRKKRGWKKAELAEKCGVSKDTIATWEKGEAEPTTTELIALSKSFNKTVDEIILNNEIIDERRENYFRVVCRHFGTVLDELWSAEDAQRSLWQRISTDNRVLMILYDVARDRFVSSNGKVYEKYLVQNSTEKDRHDWVKFINDTDLVTEKEGVFQPYIVGDCEIDEVFKKLEKQLKENSTKFFNIVDKKFESNIYKTYKAIQTCTRILKNHSTYSEKKISETIENLDRIIAEQDEKTAVGRFLIFKCQEIKAIFATADEAKMAEVEDDLIFQKDYIWNKIIVEDEPAEVIPDKKN